MKTKTYNHVTRYFSSRPSRADPRGEGGRGIAIHPQQLPEIPKATLSGMRTYIRRIYRSSARSTMRTDTGYAFEDLPSLNDDYHAQLREFDVSKAKS